ncbi:aminotransferase class V-fold PLP-dependent enzyme [Olivibacter ginsenosidimutans]|uniref:Aminotransferase class V-fold PLP-dependent enzyme n=1 Tax=Olivibacter ginsenosidimutans TaxID=1176537 RepID=A0ABP9C5U8_9SPHI
MQIQDQFPALKNSTYLNTATSCLLAKDILHWRRQHDEAFLQQGYAFRGHFEEFLVDVKRTVANFFHADAQNTFLLPNFSFGFNTFLQGLASAERILLLQEDYPSVNYPIERLAFPYAYVSVSASMEDDILRKIETFKPTVFAFSLVQYISGIKIDFKFLKHLKEKYPDMLLLADGTQYCGTEVFDFKASGLDLLASSGYKWMMAGYGSGFLLLQEQAKARLHHVHSTNTPSASFLREKDPFSLYFEPGHQDTLVFGTLKQAILLLQKTGIQTITDINHRLSIAAKIAFTERGLLTEAVVKRKQHATIFNLDLSETCYQQLQEQQIICVRRGSGVRVGFHFFNTEADLATLLQVIDTAINY